MSPYIELLCQLIRLRPVSEKVENVNRVTDALHDFLQTRNLHCTVENLNGRKILYASTQPGKTPKLLFNAHIDVVPAAYEEQYEPQISGNILSGRGSADCLGNAVCIVQTLCEIDRNLSVGAIFSADEEIGGDTTAEMLRLGYCGTELVCVVDHWDNDSICVAEKGMASLTLTMKGHGGHSSTPWNFDNPLEKLMAGYTKLIHSWQNPTAEDQWHDSIAATLCHTGLVGNQIPDEASMTVNLRYTQPGSLDALTARIAELSGAEVTVTSSCPPVYIPHDAPAILTLQKVMSRFVGHTPECKMMNGATDARYFADSGIPIAIFGIKGKGIHAKGECADLASYELYVQILKALAQEL